MSDKSIAPATSATLITPSDVVELNVRGIIVTGTGDVVIENKSGTTTTFSDGDLAKGIIIPLAPIKIRTGTTATVYGVF